MQRLLAELQALGESPTAAGVREVLARTGLTERELAGFIRTDPRRYHRGRVAWCPAFEVLVMTWLPGQCSPPHDHGGSICGMRVIRGTATERTYRVADDGVADPCMEERFETGRAIAGDDASVHSVHNAEPDGPPLVTLHVYAPPLREYRRFVARDEHPGSGIRVTRSDRTVCVVGGGFSGVASVIHLLRTHRGDSRLSIHLVERRGTVGEGAAYGTREPEHLLNVPARNMGLPIDDPGHFLRWLQRHEPKAGPLTFAPRLQYGAYVRQSLDEAIVAAADRAQVTVHLDEARRVVRHPESGWMVHLAHGASIAADAVIMASGHRPPGDPFAGRWHGPRRRWIADPWRPHAVTDIQPDEPVVIIGSGLTAVDVLMSLTSDRAPRRTAGIHMLSRTGLLPHVHAEPPGPATDLGVEIEAMHAKGPLEILATLRWLRARVREAHDWRSVIDGLRPHTTGLWRRLPIVERRRFMRHLRSFWEVHRHRTAPSVGRHVAAARDSGQLRLTRARLIEARASDRSVRVLAETSWPGRRSESLALDAAWVINCTGPAAAHHGDADPAMRSLIEAGLATADLLGLGIETSEEGHAIDRLGQPQDRLLVVGTLRKPGLWESTAVPELREQAAKAAASLLGSFYPA